MKDLKGKHIRSISSAEVTKESNAINTANKRARVKSRVRLSKSAYVMKFALVAEEAIRSGTHQYVPVMIVDQCIDLASAFESETNDSNIDISHRFGLEDLGNFALGILVFTQVMLYENSTLVDKLLEVQKEALSIIVGFEEKEKKLMVISEGSAVKAAA